jgi:hypothetical protein
MKKKLSTGKVLLIGGGVLAAAYAVYEFLIKPRQTSGEETNLIDVPPGFTPGQSSNMQNLINSADNVQPNVMPRIEPFEYIGSKITI